jgi:hypothetical protein
MDKLLPQKLWEEEPVLTHYPCMNKPLAQKLVLLLYMDAVHISLVHMSVPSGCRCCQHSFIVCIADLSFNNQLLDLSYPVRHSAAAVGRCQHVPVPRVLEERMQANEISLALTHVWLHFY